MEALRRFLVIERMKIAQKDQQTSPYTLFTPDSGTSSKSQETLVSLLGTFRAAPSPLTGETGETGNRNLKHAYQCQEGMSGRAVGIYGVHVYICCEL